jgi:sulfite reductase (NADPH) flavoprotein alpha-component
MNDASGKPVFGPKNPFPAKILEKRLLNRPGSGKDTLFLRLALGETGPRYEPGDLLGVRTPNAVEDVERFQLLTGIDCGAPVRLPGLDAPLRLREAMEKRLNFRAKPTSAFLRVSAAYASDTSERASLEALAADADLLARYAEEHRIPDVFLEFKSVMIPPQALVTVLPPLHPRLYSIASSPRAHPGEAHITVSIVRYEGPNGLHNGVASTYLADVLKVGDALPVFVSKGQLRLPEDDRDIIMIGPGTGIAPFRAFLEEREVRGAKGRNWLFYGHRSEADNFYFRDEINRWKAEGHLSKLSLAWSRDGAAKLYVQHLLWDARHEVIDWVEGGASIYICGDKAHMAADVTATLERIGRESGDEAWLNRLKREKRFQSDTY